MKKEKPKELEDLPPKPEGFDYLHEWLQELPKPLTYSELESWARLTGRNLRHWEVEVLMALDRIG